MVLRSVNCALIGEVLRRSDYVRLMEGKYGHGTTLKKWRGP